MGLEPTTSWLPVRCSTNWATGPKLSCFKSNSRLGYYHRFHHPVIWHRKTISGEGGTRTHDHGRDRTIEKIAVRFFYKNPSFTYSTNWTTSPVLVAIHDLQPRFDCHLKLQWCRLITLHGRGYLPGRFSTFPIGSVCGHRWDSNPRRPECKSGILPSELLAHKIELF